VTGKNEFATRLADEALQLHRAGRLDEAIPRYKQALEIDPTIAYAYTSLGVALRAKSNYPAAIACYRRALEFEPDNSVIHSNLGNALRQAGFIDEAVTHQLRAIELNPNEAEPYYNCGVALKSCNRMREALEYFTKAVELSPNHVEARWDRALVMLHLGDYEEGWKEYEWRWKRKTNPRPDFAEPLWNGMPFKNKTLLLYTEQGFGDTIQFIRYAPMVKQLGGRVVFECKQELLRLLQSADGVDELVVRGETRPHFDLQCPLLSVPRLIDNRVETISGKVPYLQPPAGSGDKFKPLIERAQNRFKVGIIWSGSVTFHANHLRATKLDHFLELLRVPNVQLYSMQMMQPREQLQQFDVNSIILDPTPLVDDFADTAALIQQLDLVIMTDSSVAHLSGAMNCPIWTILCYMADWRWFEDRDDSPYYPSMRLFRQKEYDQWDDVFAEVVDALRKIVGELPVPVVKATETKKAAPAPGSVLPAAFKNEQGLPRFEMPIPPHFLKDMGISFLWKHESSHHGYEYPTRKFFDQHLQPGDVFLDIGAHWGIFSLSAATRHPGAIDVLAVEAHPDNAEHLRRWIAHNELGDQIEAINAAVGDAAGEVQLLKNSTMGFSVARDGVNDPSRTTTQMVTIDGLLAERPHLQNRRTWLKIDVEGHEPEVIRGAAQLLTSGDVAGLVWEKGRNFLASPHYEAMLKMMEQLESMGFHQYRFAHDCLGGPLLPMVVNNDLCNVFALADNVERKPVYEKPFGETPNLFKPQLPELTDAEKIAETERFIAAKSSDGSKWVPPENLKVGVELRAELASRRIPPTTSVLDLGCGNMTLKIFLGQNNQYSCADLIQRTADCQIADLNQNQFPTGQYDSIAILEVLEYIHDIPFVLKKARQAAKQLLVTYTVRRSEPLEARRIRGWFSDLTEAEFKDALTAAGWTVKETLSDRGALLFVCS
jgi:FkbM family methyltransferase